jgi:hypothetical protein
LTCDGQEGGINQQHDEEEEEQEAKSSLRGEKVVSFGQQVVGEDLDLSSHVSGRR